MNAAATHLEASLVPKLLVSYKLDAEVEAESP